MLLAEGRALAALRPDSRRHRIGTGGALDACLAGAAADAAVTGSPAAAGS